MTKTEREALVLSHIPRGAWTSTPKIVDGCGLSENATRRALHNLYDLGFIRMKYGKNSVGCKALFYSQQPAGKGRSIPPLYQTVGMDARPLARAFGNYTYLGA